MKRLGAIAAVLGFAACGGGDALRSTPETTVACDADAVRISFDPAKAVEIAAGDRTLATATFEERRVSADCEPIGGTFDEYDDGVRPQGVYRAVELECRIANGARIRVNRILNLDTGRYDGSSLSVADGERIVAAAVLKNEGDPKASRIYTAPQSCTAA